MSDDGKKILTLQLWFPVDWLYCLNLVLRILFDHMPIDLYRELNEGLHRLIHSIFYYNDLSVLDRKIHSTKTALVL